MIRPDHRKASRQCALPAALEAVGERWSFLILRAAFNGLAHFEEFQSTLGIARNILSNRLGRLVENEILRARARSGRPAQGRLPADRQGPRPAAGADRAPAMGRKWISRMPSNPVLVDRYSRQPVAPMAVRAADGRLLTLNELEWLDREEPPTLSIRASGALATGRRRRPIR